MFSGLFGNDPHTGYIVASYGITFLVLGFLCVFVARDSIKQWRSLRELEKDSGKRRWT